MTSQYEIVGWCANGNQYRMTTSLPDGRSPINNAVFRCSCRAHNVREVSMVNEGLVVVSGLRPHPTDVVIHDPILLPCGMPEVDMHTHKSS